MAPSLLQNQGFQPLAVQLRHGVHAGGYPQAHRDPFDRLLAVQAELEGLQLVSLGDRADDAASPLAAPERLTQQR